jgi:hypothetical protein
MVLSYAYRSRSFAIGPHGLSDAGREAEVPKGDVCVTSSCSSADAFSTTS